MNNQKLRSKIDPKTWSQVIERIRHTLELSADTNANIREGLAIGLTIEILSLLEEETARQREEIHAEVKKLHKASQGIRMQYRDGQAVDLLIGLFALERRLDNLTQKDKEELKPNE